MSSRRLPATLALLATLVFAACKPGAGGGTDAGTGDGGTGGSAACEMPAVFERSAVGPEKKFHVSLFHYNLQYVVGGLEGGDGYGSFCGADCDGWDNDRVEDWIVTESFAPVVDFYLAHEQWRVSLELQAYMIEVLAERHPALLEKLRTLVARDQAELVSFHYADQLFLAFPTADHDRSVEFTRDIFEQHCLPLSTAVFNQEGQAGEGWVRQVGRHGYEVAVFPKNLWRYARGDALRWPLYESTDGVKVIVGPGGVDPASGIEVTWPFFDDGELLAVSADLNPYFAPYVGHEPERLDAFADQLQALDDAGWVSEHVTGYVRRLEALEVAPKPMPPVLDGTWQAPSTDSIHRWLGGRGTGTWWADEQDNAVRSGNYEARTLLEAATVVNNLGVSLGMPEAVPASVLTRKWKDLFHAEVSDASGVNPWAAEVHWSLNLNAELIAWSNAHLDTMKAALGFDNLLVDLSIAEAFDKPMPAETLVVTTTPPLTTVVEAPGRTVTETWETVGTDGDRWRYTLKAGPGSSIDHRILSVRFPRTEEILRYSPGLMDDGLVQYALLDYDLLEDQAYLPLPNGLIGLGNDRWLIKHARKVHIAAWVPKSEAIIGFVDETPLETQAQTWVFELFDGTPKEALDLATRLNTRPYVSR